MRILVLIIFFLHSPTSAVSKEEEFFPHGDYFTHPVLSVIGHEGVQVWMKQGSATGPTTLVAVLDGPYEEELGQWYPLYNRTYNVVVEGVGKTELSMRSPETGRKVLQIFVDRGFVPEDLKHPWPPVYAQNIPPILQEELAFRQINRILGTSYWTFTIPRGHFLEDVWSKLENGKACILAGNDETNGIVSVCKELELSFKCK